MKFYWDVKNEILQMELEIIMWNKSHKLLCAFSYVQNWFFFFFERPLGIRKGMGEEKKMTGWIWTKYDVHAWKCQNEN